MISDDDFRKHAETLVSMYGGDAEQKAAMRMDMYLRNGSPENATIWRQVRAVIRDMRRSTLPALPGQRSDHIVSLP
jgi:ferric-dicitrate binding protein FerR (iron transport regulator)